MGSLFFSFPGLHIFQLLSLAYRQTLPEHIAGLTSPSTSSGKRVLEHMSQGQPLPLQHTQQEDFLTPPTSPALESFCLPLNSGCSQSLNYGSGWERENINVIERNRWRNDLTALIFKDPRETHAFFWRTGRSLPTGSHLDCLEGPFSLSTGLRPTFGTWPHHQQYPPP